ncbi:MAG: pyruvate formate-lyase-activating protein [Clostridia bacterium]|nr:pyruvate formate-lyase-activating protein [Clostridia bacterium]
MTGRISSFQSLGTVDGPGVRCVVFLQGCPLHCACCHNPETRDPRGGTETDTDELANRILRFRSYFGKTGGVTVSGGEPLMQAEFVTDLFRKMKTAGIHTALDTSGCLWNPAAEELLKYTDLVLLDYKYADPDSYLKNTGEKMETAERFLDELDKRHLPTWLRRVIIPGQTDSESSVLQLKAVADAHPCVEKVELLPFRKLCISKYDNMNMDFPLRDVPEPDEDLMCRLRGLL